MRILILEDDPRIHQPLAEDLRRQHHAVDVVEDGWTGLDFALTGVHDVVLLDILLPGLDGLEICRRLRSAKSTAFVLMITSREDVRDKVRALDWGADDYLVKPFDLAELSARNSCGLAPAARGAGGGVATRTASSRSQPPRRNLRR